MALTLPDILNHLGLGSYRASLWFSHCKLVGTDLLVSDHDDAATIERCYVPEIEKQLGLKLRVVRATATPPVTARGRTDPRDVFKKKHHKALGLDKPRDMLD